MNKIKVQIAIAVDPSGNWCACGWSKLGGSIAGNEAMDTAIGSVDGCAANYWIEAEVEVPKVNTLKGIVS